MSKRLQNDSLSVLLYDRPNPNEYGKLSYIDRSETVISKISSSELRSIIHNNLSIETVLTSTDLKKILYSAFRTLPADNASLNSGLEAARILSDQVYDYFALLAI